MVCCGRATFLGLPFVTISPAAAGSLPVSCQVRRPVLCVEQTSIPPSSVTVAPRLSTLLLSCFVYTATLPRIVMKATQSGPHTSPTSATAAPSGHRGRLNGDSGTPPGKAELPTLTTTLSAVGVMEDAPAFDGSEAFTGVDLLDPEEPDAGASSGRRLGAVVKLQTLLHENARLAQVRAVCVGRPG